MFWSINSNNNIVSHKKRTWKPVDESCHNEVNLHNITLTLISNICDNKITSILAFLIEML